MNLKDFTELQESIELKKRAKAKAEGALEQTLLRLKEEQGCSSEAKAEKKQIELEQEIKLLKSEYEEELIKFKEHWRAELDE